MSGNEGARRTKNDFRFLRLKTGAALCVLFLSAVVFAAGFFFCATQNGLEKLKGAGAKAVSLYNSGGFYAEEGGGSAKFWALARGAEGVALRFPASVLPAEEAVNRLFATVVYTETVDGGTVRYCLAPGLHNEKTLFFGKCNLVVAEINGRVTVGSPVLYCGF